MIYDRETGLYSQGGNNPVFGPFTKGKQWVSLKTIRSHLSQFPYSQFVWGFDEHGKRVDEVRYEVKPTWEIKKFEVSCVETESQNACDFLFKKTQKSQKDSVMLEEYNFSEGVRGKYAKQYKDGANVVVIDTNENTIQSGKQVF
jgi:hypothetical protein